MTDILSISNVVKRHRSSFFARSICRSCKRKIYFASVKFSAKFWYTYREGILFLITLITKIGRETMIKQKSGDTTNRVDPDFDISFDRIDWLPMPVSIYPKKSHQFLPRLFRDVHLAMINHGSGPINGNLCSLYQQMGERGMGPLSDKSILRSVN